MNPNYWRALAAGLPEGIAERIAEANPATFLDFLAPLAQAGETAYNLTVGDLAEKLHEDPLSWGVLAELGMMVPIGRVGKLRNLHELLENADDVRDVERVLNRIDEKGTPFPNYKGGSLYRDKFNKLPRVSDDGMPVVYREWDLSPKVTDVRRGTVQRWLRYPSDVRSQGTAHRVVENAPRYAANVVHFRPLDPLDPSSTSALRYSRLTPPYFAG